MGPQNELGRLMSWDSRLDLVVIRDQIRSRCRLSSSRVDAARGLSLLSLLLEKAKVRFLPEIR